MAWLFCWQNKNLSDRTAFAVDMSSYALSKAIGMLVDSRFSNLTSGFISGTLGTSDGWFLIQGKVENGSVISGIAKEWGTLNNGYFFHRLAGADAVLKKLGSPTVIEKSIPGLSVKAHTLSVSIADDYPEYGSLTVNDLVVQTNGSLFVDGSANMYAAGMPTISYNSSTGVITLTVADPISDFGVYLSSHETYKIRIAIVVQ